MLGKSIFAEGGPEPVGRAELQIMLMLGVKAEIQVLNDLDGGLCAWLNRKIVAELGEDVP
jgi:meiotic recombination protein SPO11